MSENPYSPPRSDDDPGAGIFDRHALVDIVKGWEKLRIAYNLILLVPGILVMVVWIGRQGMPPVLAVIEAVIIAIGANMAFLLGPAAELYFRAIFRKGESIGRGRLLIFGAGLVISAGVFVLAFLLGTV
ncbi:hypothetical protein HAHE_04630 [Haloferula helveola]|uniref:Uncharacterized protein n=1 Tax=Haloferula helveola TaxID=490095 RepID=A0ABN6GZ34_9BACT|nr:hypothetical protein HAHE_04630 [Haloferula helveola]